MVHANLEGTKNDVTIGDLISFSICLKMQRYPNLKFLQEYIGSVLDIHVLNNFLQRTSQRDQSLKLSVARSLDRPTYV